MPFVRVRWRFDSVPRIHFRGDLTRKFISFVFLIVLVLGLSVSCFAAYEQPTGQSYISYFNGTSASTDFWHAIVQTSYTTNTAVRDIDTILNRTYSIYGMQNNYDFFQGTIAELNYINTRLEGISEQLNGTQAYNSNYWWKGWIPDDADPLLASSVTSHNVGYRGYADVDIYEYLIPSLFHQWFTIRDNIPGIKSDTGSIDLTTQSIDNYTQQIDSTFDSLWSSLTGISGTLPSYYYFQRPTITNASPQVPYKSLNNEMIAMRAGWSGSSNTRVYDVASYPRANLTLSDRLTVMNQNLVTSNVMTFTPQSSYSLDKIDYSTGVSSSWKPVSIADFLWWIGNNNSDALNRLSFMLADDDDIQVKNDTKDQRDWVTDYYGSSSAPSTGDYDDIADGVGDFSSFLATGSSADVSTALSGLDDNTYDFWSQSVSNEINHTGTRSSPPEVIDFFSSNWEAILNIG